MLRDCAMCRVRILANGHHPRRVVSADAAASPYGGSTVRANLHNPQSRRSPYGIRRNERRYTVSSSGTRGFFSPARTPHLARAIAQDPQVSTRAGDRTRFQRVKDTAADGSSRPNSCAISGRIRSARTRDIYFLQNGRSNARPGCWMIPINR